MSRLKPSVVGPNIKDRSNVVPQFHSTGYSIQHSNEFFSPFVGFILHFFSLISDNPILSHENPSMAGIKLPPAEDTADLPQQPRTPVTGDLISDDDRSVAADSWSIKSEYGSTLDDEQRHADATEALAAANLRPSSDYRFFVSISLFLCFWLSLNLGFFRYR